MELVQARTGPTVEAGAEVLYTLITRAVAIALEPREDALIHALIARELGRWIASARHSEHGLLDVALLE